MRSWVCRWWKCHTIIWYYQGWEVAHLHGEIKYGTWCVSLTKNRPGWRKEGFCLGNCQDLFTTNGSNCKQQFDKEQVRSRKGGKDREGGCQLRSLLFFALCLPLIKSVGVCKYLWVGRGFPLLKFHFLCFELAHLHVKINIYTHGTQTANLLTLGGHTGDREGTLPLHHWNVTRAFLNQKWHKKSTWSGTYCLSGNNYTITTSFVAVV